MSDDDIIDLADKAGITFVTQSGVTSATFEWLAAFASLVAAKEREACAKVCEDEIKRVKPIYSVVAENALKAIRARGER